MKTGTRSARISVSCASEIAALTQCGYLTVNTAAAPFRTCWRCWKMTSAALKKGLISKDPPVPIVLYAEEDMAALRQMFADAAKNKKIERNVVAQFDQRDAFNRAALYLAKKSVLFGDRVEMNRPSAPRTSECLLSINQLAEILRTAEVGYSGRNSKDRNDAYLLDNRRPVPALPDVVR